MPGAGQQAEFPIGPSSGKIGEQLFQGRGLITLRIDPGVVAEGEIGPSEANGCLKRKFGAARDADMFHPGAVATVRVVDPGLSVVNLQ
jgi:hypothetical protein